MCAHLSQISRFISAGHVCGVEEEVDWVVGGVVGWFILSCKLSHRPDSMQMGVRMGGAAPYGGGLFCFARSAERTAGASTATPLHPAFTHQRSALCAAPALEARRRSQTRSKSASGPEPSPLL